ncbi:DUF4350 domain-containing protein [Microbulbifer halophilus]|uniref:DUF4350 domain-containing protein n=1 Tax=Microbulbifer halophilus TaxID=453963 RepID=A0ABW5EFT5_9GAMM|nr:DUF4350 domain-containing protein [Microbulbifer halophilus]MCW8126270.1 DUF4350 domain-containing protein [Microbulbifer halophilus]
MTAKRILLVLVSLLIGALVALFLTFFERYERQLDRGWSAKAIRNPYLAAERFLDARGLETRRADNIAAVAGLSPQDTLYVASSSQVYNGERARELLDWIERGGNAVVVARRGTEGERDWLLEELGVTAETGSGDFFFTNPMRRFIGEEAEEYSGKSASELLREHNRKLREGENTDGETPEDSGADAAEPAAPEPPEDPDVDPSALVTLTSDSGHDYRLHFNPTTLLWHPTLDSEGASGDSDPAFWANMENETAGGDSDPVFWADMENETAGVPFIQFERGDGLLTLMADAGLWQSDRIGHFDHVFLLEQLASDGDFVFLTRPQFDSLPVLARRYAREFFGAGALALLAWLLLRSRRFGPRAAEPETARRSLLEHIAACGHYYWREDRCSALLARYRDSLLRRLGGDNASQKTRRRLCEQLNAATGLGETRITDSLWGQPPHSEEAFTERMRNLQQIEAVL